MSKPVTKILVVMGAKLWTLNDGTEQSTGFWVEEALEPYRVFKDRGYSITVETPGGVVPTVDAFFSPQTLTEVKKAQ